MPRGRGKQNPARREPAPNIDRLPTLQWFADHGGQITLGSLPPLACVAIAANEHGMIVALQRRSKESLVDLIDRLDASLDHCLRNETFIDEINAR